ncbi:hypothetical protein Ccrd_008332, partial [Cynara cardunculus var. scolymus]
MTIHSNQVRLTSSSSIVLPSSFLQSSSSSIVLPSSSSISQVLEYLVYTVFSNLFTCPSTCNPSSRQSVFVTEQLTVFEAQGLQFRNTPAVLTYAVAQ